jgi:glycosyltransferase involved in cell wall biosynthesis
MADQAKILNFIRGSRSETVSAVALAGAGSAVALAGAGSAIALADAGSAIALAGAVSAVVPAFNEEANITPVLELLHHYPDLVQITVVDDGSTDGTAQRVLEFARRDPRIRLLRLESNRGKGAALVAGAEASPSSLLLFLDADLIGVGPQQLEQLIEPVQEGSCQMSLAVFSSAGRSSDLSQAMAPGLSGQRCLRWSLFRETPGLKNMRYGVEVALNRFARQRRIPVRLVHWRGVTHRSKYEKRGLFRGLLAYLRMYREMLRVPLRLVRPDRTREPLVN